MSTRISNNLNTYKEDKTMNGPITYNHYHKIMPSRPMARRVSPTRADIIFAAVGFGVCLMFAVYIAIHVFIFMYETVEDAVCGNSRIEIAEGMRVSVPCGLWNASAGANLFLQTDDGQ